MRLDAKTLGVRRDNAAHLWALETPRGGAEGRRQSQTVVSIVPSVATATMWRRRLLESWTTTVAALSWDRFGARAREKSHRCNVKNGFQGHWSNFDREKVRVAAWDDMMWKSTKLLYKALLFSLKKKPSKTIPTTVFQQNCEKQLLSPFRTAQ